MHKKLLGFVPGVVIGATLFISLPLFASGLAAAPSPCDTVGTPFLTITQNISNDADSGVHGNWAVDAFTENVNVWVGTDGTSYCANANTTNGAFVTAGGISPEAGTALASGITGTFTGGENYTFASTSGLALNPDYSTTSPQSITIPDSSTAGFSWWVNQVFPSVASSTGSSYVNTYSLTYVTAHNGTWTDADAVSGGDQGDLGAAVDTNTNTGYPTIQAAVDAASPGDTIAVAAGTYNENVTITKSLTLNGAQAGNAVAGRTFASSGESTVAGVADGIGTITVNAPNVTIDGFSLSDVRSAFAVYAVVVKSGGASAKITNNVIDTVTTSDTGVNGTAQGVYLEGGPDSVQVTSNSFNNIHSARSAKGILVGSNGDSNASTDDIFQGNVITNVTSDTKGAYGISFGNATAPHSNVQIKNNTISSLTGGGWIHALGLEGDTTNASITGNTITVSGSNAFAVQYESNAGATSVSFSNNNVSALSGAKDVANVATSTAVDVTNNYWGSATTPASSMTGSVTFSPWFEDAAMTTLAYTTSSSGTTTSTTDTTGSEATTTTSGGTVALDVAPNTVITGPSGWDGTVTLPTATSGFTLTADSGTTATMVEAIEVGAGDTALTLDQSARLVFAGQAGKLVGWSRAGAFTAIATTCTADTQSSADSQLAAGADCKIDAGSDLVVWTKHFTAFVVYTQTTNPTPSSGGGSGGSSGGSSGGGGGGNGAPVSGGSTGSTGTTGTTGTTDTGTANTGTTNTNTGTPAAPTQATGNTSGGIAQANGGGQVLGAGTANTGGTVAGEAAATGPAATEPTTPTTPASSDLGAAAATSGATIPGWAWAVLVIVVAAGGVAWWLFAKKV